MTAADEPLPLVKAAKAGQIDLSGASGCWPGMARGYSGRMMVIKELLNELKL